MEDSDRSVAPFCTLSPKALEERLATIRSEILPHARRSEALPQGRGWEFSNEPELRAQLEHLIELERECCRDGVTFHLEEDVDRRVLRLEVRGLDPGAPLFAQLGETSRG